MKHLTDGHVPTGVVGRLGATRKEAEALVAVRLWERVDDGYRFHDYHDRNPTKAKLEADREAQRQRVAEHRRNRKRNSERNAGCNALHDANVTPPVTLPHPIPSHPIPDRSGGGGTATVGVLAEREDHHHRAMAALRIGWSERYSRRASVPAPPAHFGDLGSLASWLVEYLLTSPGTPESVAETLLVGFFAQRSEPNPKPGWLAEDPVRYLRPEARKPRAVKRSDRLPPGTGEGFDDGEFPADDGPPRRVVSYG
jgi:hypothetical protein